ncbi:type IX secretion system outer membrane channel protein PorV [Cognataquiflexum rubidum]|uniref:type IX secretion system outer membrane channel protein PorV n=1 Tax=Cognataquiflexum rubidum TaxID=2922273 RepID=UPI001F13833E|nr:type IX secretion system outer membrane channel protein PorV [Cognataquiflexum rubidum]MCH6236557.1 type IX secretion system outer membrane channel protein PorV [Cognataquiflexum rubidum]
MKIQIKPLITLSIFSGIILFALPVLGQNSTIVSGQDPNRRVITTAVPFLNFAPDSRHSAMGDAGVATSPDAFSAHWNAGKLAFIDTEMGVSLSYSPWLGRLVNDMSLSYLTFYRKIDDKSAWGFDLRYFNMGDIQLTDGRGNELGEFTPRDIAVGGTYSRKLSEKLGLGLSARFIHSNLSGNISSAGGAESRPGVTIGTDVGLYYNTEVLTGNKSGEFSWGVSINNIGPKITYNSADDLDFIPTNFRIGTAYLMNINDMNSLTFTLDFNKLMVPSPPVLKRDENGVLVTDDNGDFIIERGRDPNRPLINGMFTSFVDAPDGFSEEMQEVMISFGMEYIYNNVFALRTGYFYENPNKGGRRYFTMGFGIDYNKLGFDFSYLVPQVQNHPLAETLRLSLTYTIAGRE